MAHINLGKQHPAAYKNVLALNKEVEEAVSQAGLDAKLAELVKIRTSQLNGCAFCLRMHTRDALEKGETTDRLAVVAAWWESQYFTDQERAALALAEEVTRPMEPGRHEWDNGALSDEQVSAVTWLAIVMNAWNRIAVRSHYPVAP
ncbi:MULTISPECIES: carboxymuconolactone decarboxylase family protein [Rhodococcus]|uniref:Carboxymuconolactone decarboxylase family protein n=3 Tax=Rhodococcus TaxID=1827 RepID=A0A495NCE0_9NOCA|nr:MULTISPECIES: carboxymuconolactone decarboxylase family protein [Rhodococcus]MCD5421797.1 carboxymuconolactone decarboxylase family protein [Rhodococcus pyridinivorans]OWY80098.1 carboxymuconolactone decarboxylase family protein [Rhodococcus sp. BUPNP1]QOW00967.1 carboxymuconolactone decarboxylase family protein [Rhodococcus pyridinivorans]USI88347.1 carboxymuconolactone decarboxylase family protein [Rhodococcus pyridinivorans]WMM70716.1 carboxymuconolactone decarboxylase family protein [Rh